MRFVQFLLVVAACSTTADDTSCRDELSDRDAPCVVMFDTRLTGEAARFAHAAENASALLAQLSRMPTATRLGRLEAL